MNDPNKNTQPLNSTDKDLLVIDVVRKQILRLLSIFLLLANVFLFLRILLRLFGANPSNPFAALIFILSTVFMLPFIGIFPLFRDEIIAGEMTVDMSALIAGFCYNILVSVAMIVVQIGTSILRMRKKAEDSIEKKNPSKQPKLGSSFSHNRF
jgi:hypothetical protein